MPNASGEDLLARNIINVHGAEAAAIARQNARTEPMYGAPALRRRGLPALGARPPRRLTAKSIKPAWRRAGFS
jgi:hypothetical protein